MQAQHRQSVTHFLVWFGDRVFFSSDWPLVHDPPDYTFPVLELKMNTSVPSF